MKEGVDELVPSSHRKATHTCDIISKVPAVNTINHRLRM